MSRPLPTRFSFPAADPVLRQLALARLNPVFPSRTALHLTRFHVQLSYRCQTTIGNPSLALSV